jgi:16S rRNA (uracil1498-N3)-methyltransferase
MGARVRVEGNQAHYLAKVMRVAESDAVVLCDDLTGEWAARVVSAGKREVVLTPVERLR